MTQTPNYNLKKPAQNEFYNVDDFNDNFDTIDDELKKANTEIGKKVNAVEGKGFSTNDYTTPEKNKLAGIASNANNYDDTELINKIETIENGTTLTNSGTIKGKPIADIPESTSKLTPILNPITNKIEWEVADMAKIGDIKTFVNAPTENWLLADGSEHYIADYQDFWDNCGVSNGGNVPFSLDPPTLVEDNVCNSENNAYHYFLKTSLTTEICVVEGKSYYYTRINGGVWEQKTFPNSYTAVTSDSKLCTDGNGNVMLVLYAGSSSYKIYTSTDGGITFTYKNSLVIGSSVSYSKLYCVNNVWYNCYCEDFNAPNGSVYKSMFVRRSDNLGANWVTCSITESFYNSTASYTQSLGMVAKNTSEIYLTQYSGNMYRSLDNGLTWERYTNGYTKGNDEDNINSQLTNPAIKDNTIICPSLISHDMGTTWERIMPFDKDYLFSGRAITPIYIPILKSWVICGTVKDQPALLIKPQGEENYEQYKYIVISSSWTYAPQFINCILENETLLKIYLKVVGYNADETTYSYLRSYSLDLSNPTKFTMPDYCQDTPSTYIKVKDGE